MIVLNYAPAFIDWLKEVASLNGLTLQRVVFMWRKYSRECQGADQCPVKFEFLKWNNLKGEQ